MHEGDRPLATMAVAPLRGAVGVVVLAGLTAVALGGGYVRPGGSGIGSSGAATGGLLELAAVLRAKGAGLLQEGGIGELLWASKGPAKPRDVVLAELREENDWKNDLILGWWLPADWRDAMPRPVQTWLRNYVVSLAIYFSVAGLWAYYVYFAFGDRLFEQGKIPSGWDMLEQIKASGGQNRGATATSMLSARGVVVPVKRLRCWLRSIGATGQGMATDHGRATHAGA